MASHGCTGHPDISSVRCQRDQRAGSCGNQIPVCGVDRRSTRRRTVRRHALRSARDVARSRPRRSSIRLGTHIPRAGGVRRIPRRLARVRGDDGRGHRLPCILGTAPRSCTRVAMSCFDTGLVSTALRPKPPCTSYTASPVSLPSTSALPRSSWLRSSTEVSETTSNVLESDSSISTAESLQLTSPTPPPSSPATSAASNRFRACGSRTDSSPTEPGSTVERGRCISSGPPCRPPAP